MSIIPFIVEEYFYSLKKHGKNVTVEMKVWGNCEKCKARIEKSLNVQGIKGANWDMKSKILTITYSPKIISFEKIHEILALQGHDTENLYAPKRRYNRLPECCKYKRD